MARILVIDDEETLTYTFACFLSDAGHEVLSASNYDEALQHICAENVDLIFSDIILGGKTGLDILREVKARGLNSPVVMITGFPDARSAAEAVRLGAFDYIAKPVVKHTLLHLTQVALRHKRALDETEKYRLHMEAIYMSVQDAIIAVDHELKIVELNASAMSICGLSGGDMGRRLADLEMPCKDRVLAALRETLQSLQSVKLRRLECRRSGRPAMVVSISTHPLQGGSGTSLGAVLVVRDETRLAGLEQDLHERDGFHRIVGKSPAMQQVYDVLEYLADVETTVLITGESGTGKELIAEALHDKGNRSSGPFIKVNCAALSENLLESELFGHVKGAFTGAVGDRRGRFQAADGGTILLDEIGDISPKMQLRLLRVLQEKQFERVGDSRPIRVDVRVIASTNQKLKERVASGDFREDLYYRLRVVEIVLPPLRERRGDIPLLVAHFIEKLNRKLKRKIQEVTPDAEDLLMAYPWPGNVRELEHALEHAFIVCRQETICADHFPPELRGFTPSACATAPVQSSSPQDLLQALRRSAWNKAKAARMLHIDRKTLYRKMAKCGIPLEEAAGAFRP
ncbi:MAG: response regulator [Desulfobacteraceae bacterium]|nr:MAG: response regulator [Desulfobacteraceae bacterium]